MLRLSKNLLSIIFLAICFFALPAYSLPSFPSAEGYGAVSVGGRGGRVIKVTNLNDSGAGSLRAAVEAEGPRIVVFEISGHINLDNDLRITEPYLTIAGQTSPGGILITGKRTLIYTHNVIIQFMRFRIGSHKMTDAEKHDNIQVLGKYWSGEDVHSIIFDHCSISWGVDENMDSSGGVTNFTIQWSIFSEGLSNAGHPKGEHSKGLILGGKYRYPNSVSFHHNFIAHNTDRNPLVAAPTDVDNRVDVLNNVIYNWYGGLSPLAEGAAKVNWIHNYARKGPSSNSYSREISYNAQGSPESAYLYVYGNIGSTRTEQNDDHWTVANGWRNEALSEAYRRSEPWEGSEVATTVMTEEYAIEILSNVGAMKPARDSVDTRIVNDFISGTGDIIDDIKYPDDFPIFPNTAPPVDADNDGMADAWEEANGLNTAIDDSNLDKDCDGYPNIEDYLHYLADYPEVSGTCTASPALPPGRLRRN